MNEKNNKNTPLFANTPQNIVASISYLSIIILVIIGLGAFTFIVPLLIYHLKKDNTFIRKHIAQSFVLSIISSVIGFIGLFIAINTFSLKLGSLTSIAGLGPLFVIISILIGITLFALVIFAIIAMFKAYKNEDYQIPVIGRITNSFLK